MPIDHGSDSLRGHLANAVQPLVLLLRDTPYGVLETMSPNELLRYIEAARDRLAAAETMLRRES